MPQPPQFLGFPILSHFTQAKILPPCFPLHKSLWQIGCILVVILLGIQARAIQYTSIAFNIDLISTNMPALDNHLYYQMLMRPSIFAMSQVQYAKQ